MTALKELIRRRIEARGPVPFEDFMEVALYERGLGFFGADRLRSERGGDFLTSPEVSALFGETLAVHVARERDRIGDPFEVVEAGAGSGSLLRALLAATPVPARAIEASPAARASLSEIPGIEVGEGMPERVRGVILANELLDNLPMALAQLVDGRWRERWVGWGDDGLALVDTEPRPEVASWLESYAGAVGDGGWVEVQIRAGEWLGAAIRSLEAGSVVVIDYGDTAENLVPRRADGTLRTYRAHHLGPHPLDEPGETDITADVNFTALLDVAARSGAEARLWRQDDFLADLGLRDRLSTLRRLELDMARSGQEAARLEARSRRVEAETLLHPRGLGDFRALVASI